MNTSNKYIISFFLLFAFAFSSTLVSAQSPKKQTVRIETNPVCSMCKTNLEKALKQQPGIIYAIQDMDSKVLTVRYKTRKISADEIRKAITDAGYNADEMKANPEARERLDDCCKVPE